MPINAVACWSANCLPWGKGGWSGFPAHKHDEDREGIETRFEEVYQFRFDPPQGFGAQFLYTEEDKCGPCYMVKDGSVIAIDKGYHPSVVAPGLSDVLLHHHCG